MKNEQALVLQKYIKELDELNPILKEKYLDELNLRIADVEQANAHLETKAEEIIQKLGNKHYKHLFKSKDEKKLETKQNIKLNSRDISPFIVHGHDNETKTNLKDFLQNKLKFKEPIILQQKPGLGDTVIEKFEKYALDTNLVFVLLTPDDIQFNNAESKKSLARARQNVIFELGYFIGKLGRKSGKIILLKKGNIEFPSDLKGVIYIDITIGIEETSQKIRDELDDYIEFT